MYSIFGLLSVLLIGVILIILLLRKSEDDVGYVNDRPVIGIITIPEYGQNNQYPQSSNTTFIHTQYVKYVESVGAVAIPIHYNEKPQRIEYLMEHINGVLFTGGALDFINEDTGELLPYSKTVNTVFEKAKKLNDNGVHFPIWGTCMGHQFMMFLVSKDPNLLRFTDSERTQDKLIFNFTDKSESKFFSDFSNELLNIAKTKNVTANFHSLSILTEDFLSEKKPYTQFFKLLSTSLDRKGVPYVSNSEARNYPFFSSQYHPEVTLYTFSYNFTDHSKEARDFAYSQSLKFVNEARKNSQNFDTFTELQSLLVETTGVSKLGYKPSGEYYDNFYFFIGGEQENISE